MTNMIYVIFSVANIADVDFSKVIETSQYTLRLSIDGTKTILKFKGETPDSLIGLQQYNKSEIIEILSTPEWAY
jgi:hypothetical protein